MKRFFAVIFLMCLLLICIDSLQAQKDTSKTKLTFDFGITRGKNIELWPLVKINRTEKKHDVQLFFTIYRKLRYLDKPSLHSHLVPIFWYDSSNIVRDLRLGSIYYPSLLRFSTDVERGIKSFRFFELAPEINMLEFSKSADGLYVQNNMFFFIWYSNDKKFEKAHLVIFPLYYWYKNSSTTTNVLFPLYMSQYNASSNTSFQSFTPLFWHFSGPDGYRNILFPFYWNKKNGQGEDVKKSNVIFPVFWSFKGKGYDNTVLLPIIYSFKNETRQSFTLFPIISGGRTYDNSSNHLVITPLFWHLKDGHTISNVLFPFWWNKQSGENEMMKSSNVVFPFYWSFQGNNYDNKLFLPIFYSFKNELRQSFTVAPIFSAGHSTDNKSSYFMATPLVWHFRDGDSRTNIFFPFWWYKKTGEGETLEKTNIILPLYLSYQSKNFNNKIFLPVFYSFQNELYKSITVAPVFSMGHSFDNKSNYLMATPLFWHFKDNDTYRNVLFPVWWNKKTISGDNIEKSNLILPIFWSEKTALSSNLVVFPLVWSFRSSIYQSFTFLPFYSGGHSADNQRKHLAITPLYWNLKYPDGKFDFLFPFWWHKQTGSGANETDSKLFLPFYWSYKSPTINYRALFPIMWSLKDDKYQSFTFMPLYSGGHTPDNLNSHLAITPLFWHFRTGDNYRYILFPFWWYKSVGKDGEGYKKNTIFPLWWSYKDKDQSIKFLAPIMLYSKKPNYLSFTLLPLMSFGHSDQSSYIVATPLFWHTENQTGHTNLLLPIWWNKKENNNGNIMQRNVIFPLVWTYKDNTSLSIKVLPLLYYSKDAIYKSFTFAPLVSYGKFVDKSDGYLMVTPFFWHFYRPDGYRNILFPFWWNQKEGVGADEKTGNIVLPLYWSYKDKDINNKILAPVFWYFNNPKYESFTVAPVFSIGHSSDNQKKHLMLTPLFWHFSDNKKYSNLFIPFWYNFHEERNYNAIDRKVFFPVYWSYADSFATRRTFFPLIWYDKNIKYTSLTVAPLFSYGQSTSKQQSHLMITPLYWRTTEGQTTNNIVFPVWWSSKTGKGASAIYRKMLFPIFWSHKDSLTDRKTVLPLLMFYRKNPKYTSFTFAPLVSVGESVTKKRSHFMLTPLFWHVKYDGTLHDILFPVFWSYKDSLHDKKTLFPIVWYRKSSGFKSSAVLPLYYFGQDDIKTTRTFMLTPLFWNIHRPTHHRVTFFPVFNYYSDVHNTSKLNLLLLLYRYKFTREDGLKINFLWPLCEYKKNDQLKYFRFAPIVWYKQTPQYHYFTIQPFFYHRADETTENYNIMWYLFYRKTVKDSLKSNNFLWKAIYWNKYKNNDHEFRIFYLLFANVEKQGSVVKAFFPFYSYTSEPNGDKNKSIFLSFYSSIKQKIPDSNEFYEEQKIFWFLRLRSNFKSLKERGIIKDERKQFK